MTVRLDKELARRHFSRAAHSYDTWSRPQQMMADRLMRLISDIPAPASILEVGCGTGILTRMLLDAYPHAHITAIDIADGMVDVCRRKFYGDDRVCFEVADVETWNRIRDFDLIASNSCLQWMSDLPETFTRLMKLLSPGGTLAFSSPVHGTLSELWSSYAAVTGGTAAGHRLPEKRDYRDALLRAGFHSPSIDVESMVLRHQSASEAVQSVRQTGATRAVRDGRQLTRTALKRLLEHYDTHFRCTDGGVTCTYNVVYVSARR